MHVKIASRTVCIVSHVRKQKSVVRRLFCRWTVTCVVSGCREALTTAAGAQRTRSPRTAACSRRGPSGQSGHGSVNRPLPVLGSVLRQSPAVYLRRSQDSLPRQRAAAGRSAYIHRPTALLCTDITGTSTDGRSSTIEPRIYTKRYPIISRISQNKLTSVIFDERNPGKNCQNVLMHLSDKLQNARPGHIYNVTAADFIWHTCSVEGLNF